MSQQLSIHHRSERKRERKEKLIIVRREEGVEQGKLEMESFILRQFDFVHNENGSHNEETILMCGSSPFSSFNVPPSSKASASAISGDYKLFKRAKRAPWGLLFTMSFGKPVWGLLLPPSFPWAIVNDSSFCRYISCPRPEVEAGQRPRKRACFGS